jgi:hypothetical protein
MASAPSTVSHRIAANTEPTRSPLAFSGRPNTVVASSNPTPSAGTQEPNPISTSQRLRQRGESILPRYSNATPRPISASNTSASTR